MSYKKMDEQLGQAEQETPINSQVTVASLIDYAKNISLNIGVQTLGWLLNQIEDMAESGIYTSDEEVFGGCLNTDLSKLDLSFHDDEYGEDTNSSFSFK